MLIAIPTGVKVFSWIATVWGGRLRFTTAMLFALGFILEFTIGGLSGVMHASAPIDLEQTDTYIIVAHFHYVLFGGVLMAHPGGLLFLLSQESAAGCMNETLGKWHFWLTRLVFQRDLLPDAFPRRMGYAAAHLHLRAAHGLGFLEQVREHQRLHALARRS